PIIDVIKVPNHLSLPNGPGPVVYSYTLRNLGTVAVTNVTMDDDKCNPVNFTGGDNNNDSILDINEVWVYTCSTTLNQTTTNTATVRGRANGFIATDIAIATVNV